MVCPAVEDVKFGTVVEAAFPPVLQLKVCPANAVDTVLKSTTSPLQTSRFETTGAAGKAFTVMTFVLV